MKNLFNSFYSIVLLALCLITFSNCSDSDDGGDVGDTDNGMSLGDCTETRKTISIYGETVEISFGFRNGLFFIILQEQIGLL